MNSDCWMIYIHNVYGWCASEWYFDADDDDSFYTAISVGILSNENH